MPLEHEMSLNVMRINVRTEEECRLYNRNMGEKVKLDSGYMMPKIFHDAGLKAYTLDMIYNKSDKAKLPWHSSDRKGFLNKRKFKHQSEWHYENELFATHRKETGTGSLIKDELAQVWKKRIDMYTEREFGIIL